MIVTNFFEAFQAGKELSNAKTWKNAQLVTSKLTVLATAGLAIARAFGYDFGITDEQMLSIVLGVGALVSVFMGAATVVSSSKVGMRRVPDRGDNGRGEGTDSAPAEPAAKPGDADVFNTGYRG
jgi:hypothetical protein